MNARLEAALLIVVITVIGLAWVHQYVMPKSATLTMATACMSDQGLSQDDSAQSKEAWEGCLEVAETAKATPLLLALGY